MIDLDFLLNDNSLIKKHVLYSVKTHALRPAVSTKLREYAESRGLATRTLEYSRPILSAAETSLLCDFFVWVDLDELSLVQGKSAIDDFSSLASLILDSKTENRFFIYGSADSKIPEHPSYSSLTKVCTFLTEAEPSNAILSKLVEFISRFNPSLELGKLKNKPVFLEHLKTLLDDEITLSELLHAIEYYATLTISSDLNTFDPAAFLSLRSATQKVDYYRWHRLLFNLLTTRSRASATTFMRELDVAWHINGFEPRSLITILYKTTHELYLVAETINKTGTKPNGWSDYKWKHLFESFRKVPLAALLTWSVHLSMNEADLNQDFVSSLERVFNSLITA